LMALNVAYSVPRTMLSKKNITVVKKSPYFDQ
jgi:hypothetical protein